MRKQHPRLRWLSLLVGCLGLLLGGWAGAATIDPTRIPPPPATHVLDVAGLFEREPERLEEISGRLLELQERHELPVYLVIYPGLIHTSIEDQARALFKAWIPTGEEGIVVTCDTDTQRIEFGLPDPGMLDGQQGEGRVPRLPDYRLLPVLDQVLVDLEGTDDQADYIDRLSLVLFVRLSWMLRDGQTRGTFSAWKVAGGTVAVCLILGTIGLIGARFVKKTELKAKEQFFFPEVLVGTRLGAPCGGGRGAVVDYYRLEGNEEGETETGTE